MNKYSSGLFLTILGATVIAAGCSSAPGTTQATGGKSGAGGTKGGGGSTGTGTSTVLTADMTGWVDHTTNSLGIQGAWYAYGDGYGTTGTPPGDCKAATCSVITAPVPGSGAFAPTGTAQCTAGTAAIVPTAADYPTVWGGGIGFDLNNTGGANPVKSPYDAPTNKVIGFSFTIDMVPLGGIRVEIPTPTTGSTAHFKTITTAGPQTVLLSEVLQGSWVVPATTIDPKALLSVQFHVPTTMSSPVPYTFCVDKFAAVTQ
jgi:hypothetical protein